MSDTVIVVIIGIILILLSAIMNVIQLVKSYRNEKLMKF